MDAGEMGNYKDNVEESVELDFKYKELVEVKAPGVRLRQRGHIVNWFSRGRPIYAVQFPDNCVGYFDESELEKIPPEEAATDWERGIGFEDIIEKASKQRNVLTKED